MSGSDVTLVARELAVGYRSRGRESAVIAGPLDLELRRGELVCLLGPNGAGKSTLMRSLTGMQAPLAGRVELEGKALADLPPSVRARRLAVVLTDRVAVGVLTARAVVELGRYPFTPWHGRLSARDHAAVDRALRSAGAEELAERSVAELSDGERQKVMIARALAQEPAVLVLDEITAFLDLPRRVEAMRLLRELARREGTAVLVSSHDLELSLRTADRVWLLAKGGAFASGVPEELVLQGAFASTFASEGLTFDRASGNFRLDAEQRDSIAVAGEGVLATWTARAVERLGYQARLDGAEADRRVEVEGDDEVRRWKLHGVGEEREGSTLSELVVVLAALAAEGDRER
ncbi:MAG: ABC transporter ATP-binding protein [Acidobacteriota bacterium]